jgi:hypothetical protein
VVQPADGEPLLVPDGDVVVLPGDLIVQHADMVTPRAAPPPKRGAPAALVGLAGAERRNNLEQLIWNP